MLFNHYLRIGIRHLLKHPTISASIILGYSLALSLILPIIILFDNQSQYDTFHKRHSSIYRITTTVNGSPWATSPIGTVDKIKAYPFIQETIAILPVDLNVGLKDLPAFTLNTAFVDSSFFNV